LGPLGRDRKANGAAATGRASIFERRQGDLLLGCDLLYRGNNP
jgi:hypothetical protein